MKSHAPVCIFCCLPIYHWWCESREVNPWAHWTLWLSRVRMRVRAKWEDGGRTAGRERRVRCVSEQKGLAYLDWFQPQHQPVRAPVLPPLSSPLHPNLITQPCDSEPGALETDKRGVKERDRQRLDFMSSNIGHIYQFHFQSNRAEFCGWNFVSKHVSAQFIKYPQRLCLLAEHMRMT